MANDAYIKGKDKNQLLSELLGTAQPGSSVHEQQKMAILVRCTEDLEAVLDRLRQSLAESSVAADRLASKVFWLNVVITCATVAGVIVAIVAIYKG